jgi:cytochrome c5
MDRPNRHARLAASLIALGASLATPCAFGQKPDSGEAVYQEVCAACHGTGVPRAPQLGKHRQWAPLIREGQAVLTAHAWVGVRGMPARGGRSDLDLATFSSAVAYMAGPPVPTGKRRTPPCLIA